MMKKYFVHILLILGVLVVSSCDFDELLDSPNDITLSSADATSLLNRIQVNFADFYYTTSLFGGRVTRILHQAADTYEISYQAVTMNGVWNNAYANILNDIKNLKELAAASNFRRHLGIAKTLEAYVWMTLVDVFGDVPLSEALDPSNFNPKVDNGAAVYQAALALLASAREDFTATSIGTPTDFFYANNYTRWIRLTNTLELRYHLNRRLIDSGGATSAINALIAGGNLLQEGDDFYFRYGRSANDPDSRHPWFSVQFPQGGGHYQSVFFMWHLTEAKGFDDPRAKYYFYRQVAANPTSEAEARCVNEFVPFHYPQGMPWCMPGERGYWGRDHLDPQGIPPDNNRRTLYGIYPAGVLFDNNAPASITASTPGNGGAGILPIMLASYVDFMRAEAALQLGTTGSPKDLMVAGATKHINFVRTWSLTTTEAAKIRAFQSDADYAADRDRYTAHISAEYDAAASNIDRMRLIAREYWISLYGGGNEAYNLYRRTGQPDNMQPGQIPNFGRFPRTFPYPDSHVNRNANAQQKPSFDSKVFWDNNPDGFIN
ncbi:MAG TPA: SusD/RagB family nutrient-binding outer membrane lipoprotein [Saprospiraceae bacterium]|nr:SusD/RagB family nutrient-binding outer membrane lipoprotein [Saprospiraceae bacterium]HMP22937.1 SusD/RagB family nutrient-binding outer membrane lipoprotein [Saprospiraceae bacterium]